MKQLNKIGIGRLFAPGASIQESIEYIEEWVKKKIILATDYLDSVRDYVMSSHGKHGRDEPDPVTGGFMVMVEKRMP